MKPDLCQYITNLIIADLGQGVRSRLRHGTQDRWRAGRYRISLGVTDRPAVE